jgi:UDP-4-amino-4,6-dideoxy-N-acetyl-beta-L-altrosamine N-acetyltransferase
VPETFLRPVTDADKQRLFDWRNSPEVARWMYSDHQISREEHEQWFSSAIKDPTREYWVIEVEGDPVGLVNLYDIDQAHARASWAYYLAAPGVRGRGVGACVEFLVLEHVFIERGLNKLWCEVLAENEAVARLHLSFGFRQEALFRQHIFKQGRFVDVLGLGLLRGEWLALRAGSCERLAARGHDVSLRPLRGASRP